VASTPKKNTEPVKQAETPKAVKDNKTAGGLFMSTGNQEFHTDKATGSISVRYFVSKRNIVPVKKSFATPEVKEVSRFNADTVVRIDKAPVRPLDFANAKNVPPILARKIQEYAKENNAVLYGSLNAYTKMENAPKPNDIDLAFDSRPKAQREIMKLAATEGYKVKPGLPHSVKISEDGKTYKEIVDVDSIAHHKSLLPRGLSHEVLTRIDGIDTETLGEQYLRQSYGAASRTKKAPERAEKVRLAAAEVKQMLLNAGARPRSAHHTPDYTKAIADKLGGSGNINMHGISRQSGRQFKTRVNGGSLVSASPIRGR
jgi:hypothetical protein